MRTAPAFRATAKRLPSFSYSRSTVKPTTSRYQVRLRSRSFTVSDAPRERPRNDSGSLRVVSPKVYGLVMGQRLLSRASGVRLQEAQQLAVENGGLVVLGRVAAALEHSHG